MAKIADLRRQIDQLDRQIVDLLARRTKMAKGVHDQMEDEEDPEWDQQVLANWLEEGFDHGLEDAPLEKVCRATMDMGKKAVEIG